MASLTSLGTQTVTDRRMDALASAIKDRNWQDAQFIYDQVLRALDKERRQADGAQR